MGYDFTIIRLDRPVSSIHEVDSSMLLPLGTVQNVRDAISASFPDVTWTATDDGAQGRWFYPGRPTWMDFTIYDHGQGLKIDTAFGPGDDPLVERLCRAAGWTACDPHRLRLLGANVARE